MRFITEEDLRARYRNEHFTSYRLEPGTRLTPGARQYLSDLGIRMPEEEQKFKKKSENVSEKSQEMKTVPLQNPSGASTDTVVRTQEWKYALKSIQARFLETGIEFLSQDVLMAQEIFELERVLSEIGREEQEKEKAGIAWKSERKICQACSGISPEQDAMEFPDCFEVTGFHAQSPRGREIVRLHLLRCELREFAIRLPDQKRRTANQVINRLSQMICQTFGGKICQKN